MFRLQIEEAETSEQIHQVESLLRDYFLWLRRRYVAEMPALDGVGYHQFLEYEIANLKRRYGAPTGAILLATIEGRAVGCAILRRLKTGESELRRVWVLPPYQKRGIGSMLIARIAEFAVERGPEKIRLEVGPKQEEALHIFKDLGFKTIAPYCDPSYIFKDHMIFMEAETGAVASEAARRVLCQYTSMVAA